MEWSTALPTVEGWYFWEPSETTRTVFRAKLPRGVYFLEWTGIPGEERLYLALPRDRNRYPAEWMGGRWGGPIAEPSEPMAKSGLHPENQQDT